MYHAEILGWASGFPELTETSSVHAVEMTYKHPKDANKIVNKHVDPDHTAPKKQSDLDLYCLLRHVCPNIITKVFSINSHEPCHEKTCLMPYVNNKGADQPAHPRSLSAPLFFAAWIVLYLYLLYPKFQDSG